MAKFEKGKEKTGGRKPGVPNKTTAELRQILTKAIEYALPGVQDALSRLEEEDPAKFLKAVEGLAQYALPKLQHTQIAGDDDKPLVTVQLVKRFEDPEKPNDGSK